LTSNVNYIGRTAPLTSKVAFYIFIQQIYVLNILNMIYTLLFFSSKCSLLHNSNVFGSVLFTFYIQGVLKLKKLFFSSKCSLLHNSNVFGSVLFTFYIQGVLKLKKLIFYSKCSLLHNSNVFGSCFIHIFYTGCAKIKKNNSGAKRIKG